MSAYSDGCGINSYAIPFSLSACEEKQYTTFSSIHSFLRTCTLNLLDTEVLHFCQNSVLFEKQILIYTIFILKDTYIKQSTSLKIVISFPYVSRPAQRV